MSEHLPGFTEHAARERGSVRAAELGPRVIDAELREQRSPSKTVYDRIWEAEARRNEREPREAWERGEDVYRCRPASVGERGSR